MLLGALTCPRLASVSHESGHSGPLTFALMDADRTHNDQPRGYTTDEPWYRRMLGPASLSWQTIVFAGILNFPQMVLTGGNLGARTVQPDEYPTIAAVSAATIAVSFLYGFAADKTAFRHRHTRPVALTTFLVFYAGGGLLYSVGIQISDAVANSPSDVPFALRAVNAMLLSIAWGIAVALVLDGRSRFQQERNALVEDLVAQHERSENQSQTLNQARGDLATSLESSLNDHLESIRQASEAAHQKNGSIADIRQLAATIDTAADVGARQASHQMWQEALTAASTPKAWQTLRTALTTPRLWPAPMAVLVALGVPTVAVRNFGIWWALPLTVALGIIAWQWIRVVLNLRLPPWPAFLTAFLGTVALVAAFAIIPSPLTPQVIGEVGAIVIGLIGGFVLISFVACLQRERAEALETLRTEIAQEEATRIAEARAVAALARRLHGPVQTTLRVCASEIDRAADANDASAIDAAVEVAMRTLLEATQASTDTHVTITDSLTNLAASWKGFMEVSVTIDNRLDDYSDGGQIIEIVSEALSNAHHHGQADAAEVTVQPDPSGIRIHVGDNGSSASVGQPGLGTRLLRTLALDFNLSVTEQGSSLNVVLAVPGKHSPTPRDDEPDHKLVFPTPTSE